ncbi:5579_t:CDS:1, partial [Cetraspora pellucida]
RPTINEILDKLNLISKKESTQFITNCNIVLIPELDETISKHSQFHKNMHNDDLSKNLLRATSVQKSRKPSYSSLKTSGDSLTNTSSMLNDQRTRELSRPSLNHSKGSFTNLIGYFFRQKLDSADKLRSQGQIYYVSGNYKESLDYLNESLKANPDDADAL